MFNALQKAVHTYGECIFIQLITQAAEPSTSASSQGLAKALQKARQNKYVKFDYKHMFSLSFFFPFSRNNHD